MNKEKTLVTDKEKAEQIKKKKLEMLAEAFKDVLLKHPHVLDKDK